MEIVQQRRRGFRQAIRRDDLKSRMSLVRAQLSTDLHASRCKDFVDELCAFDPSSLFIKLATYISSCMPAEKRPWAYTAYEMLTTAEFERWQYGYEGLSQLVLAIYDELDGESQSKLSSRIIIESLLDELQKATLNGANRQDQLFRVVFQLSIYASKQSKFHINFSEERVEAIIDQAYHRTNPTQLQMLAAVLVNLEENDLRGSLIRKVKQIGRSIYKSLHSLDNRLLHLRVLALVGLFCHFDESEVGLVRVLLDSSQELEFSLKLRFLNSQASEDWISFKMAEAFLLSCPQHLQGSVQKNLFLELIYKICRSEYMDSSLLAHIYKTFFAGRLHHFVEYRTLAAVTEVIITFFMEKQPEFEQELTACALMILKKGPYSFIGMQKDHIFMLCQRLSIKSYITEEEIVEYIGKELYLEYWDKYESNNQAHDF